MKPLILITILLISFSASASVEINFTKEEKEYIASNVFKLGMILDNYPFSFEKDGELHGFSYDYINLITKKSGLKLQIEMDGWSNTLNKFKHKEIHLIDFISYKKSRESFTNYSKPYLEIPSVVFARKGEFTNYSGFESLKGKNVGITKDTYYYDYINDLNLFNLVTFTDSRQKMKALVYGKVDVIFHNLVNALGYIKSAGYTNIEILDELDKSIVQKEDLRIGVIKEDDILYSIINKSTNAITVEEKEALSNKWFSVNIEKAINEKGFHLTLQEEQYLKEKKVIKMCVLPDWLPFEQIDKSGEHKGIGADIINIISEKIKTPIKLVPTQEWSTSLQNINERKCDILPVVMDIPSRRKTINFTKPYISEPFVIATKVDELFIKDVASIGNRKIGIVSNYAFSEVLKTHHPEINIFEVKNVTEGLKKVQSGELFGYIDIMEAIGYNIQKHAFVDLKIAGKLEHTITLSIGSRSDEALLNSIMQKGLNSIGKDKLTTILGHWIKIKVEQSIDYIKLIYIAAFFSIILLLILYKNRAINKINEQLESLNHEIEEQNTILEKLAVTDKLTGLYNRNKLDEILISEQQKAKRYSYEFGIIMIDIDYFKRVNDEYGHQVGDTVLKDFAQILNSNIRETDTVGRWGGEEFLIVSTQTNLPGLICLATALQQKIASYSFSISGQKTASFGVASFKGNENVNEIVKRADDALYKAKNNGRNRVEIG